MNSPLIWMGAYVLIVVGIVTTLYLSMNDWKYNTLMLIILGAFAFFGFVMCVIGNLTKNNGEDR